MRAKPTCEQLANRIKELEYENEILRQALPGQLDEPGLHAFLRRLPVMVCALDSEGTLIFWNDESERVTGFSAKDVVGNQAFTKRLWPGEIFRKRISGLLNYRAEVSGRHARWNSPVYCRDGLEKIVSWSCIQVHLIPGCNVWCIGWDITVCKTTEEQFRMLAENIPVGISLMDRNREFEYFNPRFTAIFGYDLRSMPDKATWFRKAYPEPNLRREIMAFFESDWAVPETGMVRERILPVHTADGRERMIHMRGVITRNEKHLLTYEDITERKQAEDALRESEERFRTIFETARDGIFIKDRNLRYILVNPTLANMFCTPAKDIIGVTAEELYEDKKAGTHSMKTDRRIFRGEIVDEIQKVPVNGSIIILHVIKVPIYDGSNDIIGICGIARDITQTRQLEARLRQAQKLEAVGTLAGGIAHDFNNILGAILGYSELTLLENNRGCFDRIDHNMTQVVHACRRAKELIKQVLAVSRKSEQNRHYIELQPIIKETLQLIRATLPSTIEIQHYIDPAADCVLADATQIHQIVMNMCTNAAHAMESRGGVLEIELNRVQLTEQEISQYPGVTSGAFVRLMFKDSGCGMTHEILDKIFDPYFTTKEKSKGSGLGLAVVNGIVKSYDGFIYVESKPGTGSRFEIFIPAHPGEKMEKTEKTPVFSRGNERILFVDDEKSITEVSQYALEQLGYQVTAVTNSLEALDIFSKAPGNFDLVITDLTMPNLTGDKLALKMMDIRPDIPVIMCTGYSETITRNEALDMGIREFLQKPFILKDFSGIIRNVLSGED